MLERVGYLWRAALGLLVCSGRFALAFRSACSDCRIAGLITLARNCWVGMSFKILGTDSFGFAGKACNNQYNRMILVFKFREAMDLKSTQFKKRSLRSFQC